MAAKTKYSKLNISKEDISKWIDIWCKENLPSVNDIKQKENDKRIQYTIKNGPTIIKIDFLKCTGGALTIYPNVGVNIDISNKIAEYIFSKASNVVKDSPFYNGFSIPMLEKDFNALIELINILPENNLKKSYTENEIGKPRYKLYRYQSNFGDTVTIKYYLNTNRMQMQGKPLYLFDNITSLVVDNIKNVDDVVDAQLEYCSIKIPAVEVYEEMQAILGESLFNYLNDTHRAILASSLIFDKVNIDLQDYSGLIMPALRAFEGFAKKLFLHFGLECIGSNSLGRFFEGIDSEFPCRMKSCYSNKLEPSIERQLTEIYKFIRQNRHPYFHAGTNDFETPIIQNRNVAREKLNEIIEKMKSCHKSLISKE